MVALRRESTKKKRLSKASDERVKETSTRQKSQNIECHASEISKTNEKSNISYFNYLHSTYEEQINIVCYRKWTPWVNFDTTKK